jgi:hypothetical protein
MATVLIKRGTHLAYLHLDFLKERSGPGLPVNVVEIILANMPAELLLATAHAGLLDVGMQMIRGQKIRFRNSKM